MESERDRLEAEARRAQGELERFDAVLELVRPIMERDPKMTLEEALKRLGLWPPDGKFLVLPRKGGSIH